MSRTVLTVSKDSYKRNIVKKVLKITLNFTSFSLHYSFFVMGAAAWTFVVVSW